MTGKPVFFDSTGQRGRVLSWMARTLGTISALVIGLFMATLAVVDQPGMERPDSSTQHPSIRCAWQPTCLPAHALNVAKAAHSELLKAAANLAANLRKEQRALRTTPPQAEVVNRRPVPASLAVPANRSLSIGFYANWDDNSYPALKRALPHLDWIIPDWLSLESENIELKSYVDARVLGYIQTAKRDIPILPMIQNAVQDKWDGNGLARLLADPATRAARIEEIVGFLDKNNFQGLTVDFEEVPAAAQKNLQLFLTEMAAAFAPHRYIIVLAVPFDDDSWPYATYAHIADFMLLMGYGQHWEQGGPGSIAGQSWFEETLDERMKALEPNRTIIAIGSYGYDWVKGKPAEELTFEEAVLSARDSEAEIDFDPKSDNPHFAFIEDDGQRHDVWFLDGITAFNEIHAADVYQPAGYALWRLGSEDPSIWSVLGQPYNAPAPDGLRVIGTSEDVDFEGEGEVLRGAEKPASGARIFEIDKDTGEIDDENYTKIPTPYVIERTGAKPNELALTFDDGPDPDWTPKILDILKAKGVHASFFIIGGSAEAYPDLVQRVLAEGHDVGNHTFTHPNLGEMPDEIVTLEINATQRLFDTLTGRSMRRFRAPYLGVAEQTTAAGAVAIRMSPLMGLFAVGLHVDPNDWQRPPADVIVQRTID